ncbi:nodulation protein NfeD, partial [Candidatus Bipolaricaulota bacterium]|nr:nodulation protein NfeD [Candidatus Bipolaricaulota bacterium]
MRVYITLLALVLAVTSLGVSQEARPVWVLTIDTEIGRGTVSYLRKGLAEATAAEAQAVVIQLSTPGGYLDSAVAGRDAILDADLPTIAYVNREAYSAGALLAIACGHIYFAPAGVMGAATPVYFEKGMMRVAPEKVISATRKLFRATAETRGRPP